ncbi:MAG: cell division protein FtsA [candidate division WS1 bacterium]|nr:cell division protein FtsA [candidate division WS1 bacterium]
MPEDVFVAGIDVGTTKICAIVGCPQSDGRLEIIGVGLSPSSGLKRGIIVDREDATDSVRRAAEIAQAQADVRVESAYVGVTGAHISSVNVTGRTNVSPGPAVSAQDVQRAIQSARDAVPLPQDREIIHEVTRGFAVDGESGVARPIGMSGRRLDVELHAVTGNASIVDNVEGCVSDAGVSVSRRVLEPIATATAVITDAERDLGVILIDVGGGTSDVAVFIDGSIAHTSAVPIGGDHVTRDIARLLRVGFDEAEKLKCRYARAVPGLVEEDESVQVQLADGSRSEHVPLRLVAEIIEPRLEETFSLVRANIMRAGIYEQVSAGVVLSGGGSLLAGTAEIASRVLDGLPARVGSPRGLSGLTQAVAGPIYSTGVGLALLAARDGAVAGGAASEPVTLVDRFKQWWERLLPRA